MDLKPLNKKSPEMPETQKWGSGLAVVPFSRSSNLSENERMTGEEFLRFSRTYENIQINIPQNTTAVAGSNFEIFKFGKYLKRVAKYSFGFMFCVLCLCLIIIGLWLVYWLLLFLLAQIGVNVPDSYYPFQN